MKIHDAAIKYFKKSDGLIFKAGFDFSILMAFLTYLFFVGSIVSVSDNLNEYPFYFKVLVFLVPVLWVYYVINNYKSFIKILEDGIEIRTTRFFILTFHKKYKWQDVEKFDYFLDSKSRSFLVLKEKNKTEVEFPITLFGNGMPSQKSDKPLGCGISLMYYIEYIDFISKENAYTQFVLDNSADKHDIASEESACSFILNMVCKYNPAARSSQEIILAEKNYHLLDKFDYDDDVNGLAHAASLLRTWDWAKRKSFIELLFKLVVTDDGIKNDEWYLMQRLMGSLGFNKNWQEFYNRRYASLRTETDYKYEEQSSSTATASTGSLQAYYDVLRLPANASFSQLQAAYHQLAMENHPDLPKNANRTAECEEFMTKINEAYEALARNLKR